MLSVGRWKVARRLMTHIDANAKIEEWFRPWIILAVARHIVLKDKHPNGTEREWVRLADHAHRNGISCFLLDIKISSTETIAFRHNGDHLLARFSIH